MVSGPGDVVPATEIKPFHPGQHIAKAFFHSLQCDLQRIGILLAQGVEM